jgi:hypothetical protein
MAYLHLQVLPGRTHPLMSMSGSGGYLLQAFYVYVLRLIVEAKLFFEQVSRYNDPSASSIIPHRHSSSRKQKPVSNNDISLSVAIEEDTRDKDSPNGNIASMCGDSSVSTDE